MRRPGILTSILDSRRETPGKSRRRVAVWISIALAALFLFLAFRELDWVAFRSSLRNANYSLIPLLLISGSIAQWVRALRWQVLLTTEKHISVQNIFWANMAGYLGNNILPARAGELIRAVYVSKENNLSVSFSLATGLVERFVDLMALVILGSIAIANVEIFSPLLQDALKVVSAIVMVGIVALVVMPYFGGRLHRILETLPLLSASAKEKISGLLEQFLRGIEALRHPKRAAAFILLTSVIWIIDSLGIIIIAHALHLRFTLMKSFLLLAGLGLSSAIPSTPGYVGVYQFAAILVLKPFGISKADAIALVLFAQIMNWIVVGVWGLIAAGRLSNIVVEPIPHSKLPDFRE